MDHDKLEELVEYGLYAKNKSGKVIKIRIDEASFIDDSEVLEAMFLSLNDDLKST